MWYELSPGQVVHPGLAKFFKFFPSKTAQLAWAPIMKFQIEWPYSSWNKIAAKIVFWFAKSRKMGGF